jgi:CRP-like cAMP-binding protein
MKLEKLNSKEWVDWLQYQSHLKGLDRDECQLLGSALYPVHVEGGEVIFDRGENNSELFLIQGGHVSVGRSTKVHQWIDLGPFGEVDFMNDDEVEELQDKIILGPGDCVGESDLFTHHSHQLTAIAAEEGELLCLNADSIPKLCTKNYHVIRSFSELLNTSLFSVR